MRWALQCLHVDCDISQLNSLNCNISHMPTACCVVPGCSERGGHEFPSDPELSKAWVIAIRREATDRKGQLWKPSSNSVVCKKHFKDSDFITTSRAGKTDVIPYFKLSIVYAVKH